MKKGILTLVILLSYFAGTSQRLVSSETRPLVFVDVNVVAMTRDGVLEHQDVVVQNGRIIAIGKTGTVKYDRGASVVQAQGRYLLPGLAEMHAHVPPNDNRQAMEDVLQLFMFNGITTIRGMLGHPAHLELREAIRKGEVTGPHFYTTGPSFNGMNIRSPEEATEMVRRQKEAGYDYLKLHPGLTRAEFDALAATAREVNIPYAGHVSYGVGVWRAIEAGYSSIDHLDGFVEALVADVEKIPETEAGLFGMFLVDKVDEAGIPRLMDALKANSVWVVPTQALAERWFHPDYSAADFDSDPHRKYMSLETARQWMSAKNSLVANPRYREEDIRKFIELRRRLIFACQRHGVGLLLGCDAPQVFNVPGFSTHHELEYLVLAGLTPYEALRTGTVNVARYLGLRDAGTVEKGSVSDLILLSANPLEDIRNTRDISGVMMGNTWMDRAYLDAGLKKLEKQ